MINKCLVVCNNLLPEFTYGRIYRIIDDPDLYDTGYYWVTNDVGVVQAKPRNYFLELDKFKMQLRNTRLSLFRTGFYEEDYEL